MPEKEDFIIVEGLTKDFNGELVLQDINFKVKEGGSLGILGKSGAGKTVLMYALRGMKEYGPTQGSVIYRIAICSSCGRVEPPSMKGAECPKCKNAALDLEEVNLWQNEGTPIFREIYNRAAIMQQRTFALYGEMPVLTNVMESLAAAGVPKRDQQMQAIRLLSKVNLTHRTLHVARDLSGGEKQRVVLARQLAKGPFVLYADEPTGTLDPITADAVHDSMKLNIEAGLTTFVTSHWLEAITVLTEDGLVLENGRVVAAGKSKELADKIEAELEDPEAIAAMKELREASASRVKEDMPIVKVEGCKKNFYAFDRGIIKAVDDVSFDVNEAEIYGIVGVSGSGKTTLSQILSGLKEPSGGKILLRIGEDWVDMSVPGPEGRGRARPFISVLHQEYDLYHHASVLENLTESIGLDMPMEIARAKAMHVLRAVGFEEEKAKSVLSLFPDNLGEGERHRVALSRALMTEPYILLLDEPTGTIDPETTQELIRSILSSRQELGQTYLIVSHDPFFVEAVCDRVMWLRLGQVVKIGSPKDILEEYKEKDIAMGV
ncbi:MAG: methyl coenzyme M reductase system, component A2 [Halobacteriota archaeon]|nr:methyl coenzyme M reductase system, component A2 [Halobacteriota archaeon]